MNRKIYLGSSIGIICTWLSIFFITRTIGFPNSLFLGLIAIACISLQTDTFLTTLALSLILLPSIAYLIYTHQFAQLPNIEAIILFGIIAIIINLVIRKAENRLKIKEYQQKMEEYHKLYLQEEKSKQKAQDEIKARDEFLAIVSHELKTPLATMLLQIQLVLHNIRNVSLANFSVENLLKMLDNAEKQSKRLSKMINDLLNVSLITTGRIDLERHSMDLAETTKNIVDNFSERMAKEGYKTNLHLDSPHIIGNWDKIRIEQVISNLLTNAIKYGNQNPINISVSKNNSHAFITVEDKGIGIPEERREQIFARFARAVPAKKYDGLGVGLFITNQIVTAHGGKVK